MFGSGYALNEHPERGEQTALSLSKGRLPGGPHPYDKDESVKAPTKLTARDIVARKGGAKLTMLAAYDYPIARLIEQAGIEIILVGDSLGMAALGYDTPIPVTVEDIIHHCRAIVRGAPETHVVADLPFLSYHLNDVQALENAGRMLQIGGATSVKLEGGSDRWPRGRARSSRPGSR